MNQVNPSLTAPYNKFGVIVTSRGLTVTNPPLPNHSITNIEAVTLAARLVRYCERRPFEFRNMLLVENKFDVKQLSTRDASGIFFIRVMKPPQPGGPLAKEDGMKLAFWLNHFGETKRKEFDIVYDWLEKHES